MISKESFVKKIDFVKKMSEMTCELSKVQNKFGYGAFDSEAIDSSCFEILTLLEDIFEDKDEFVTWWVYDCDFGREHSVVTENIDGKEVEYNLNSTESLYDYLTKDK